MSYAAFGSGAAPKSLPPSFKSCGTVENAQKMLNQVGIPVQVTGVLDLDTAVGIIDFGLQQGFKEDADPDLICKKLVEVSGGPLTPGQAEPPPGSDLPPPPLQADSGGYTKYVVGGLVVVGGAAGLYFLWRK